MPVMRPNQLKRTSLFGNWTVQEADLQTQLGASGLCWRRCNGAVPYSVADWPTGLEFSDTCSAQDTLTDLWCSLFLVLVNGSQVVVEQITTMRGETNPRHQA
jgi:hypothetical protein